MPEKSRSLSGGAIEHHGPGFASVTNFIGNLYNRVYFFYLDISCNKDYTGIGSSNRGRY